MAVLGPCFCARTFSSCGKRGPLFIAVRGPLTTAAPLCCGAQAPDAQAQQLWLTGPAAPRHVGSFQTRARTRVPLHWQADSQPLRHQGSPPQILGIRPHTSRTRNMIKSVRWLTLIKKFKHHFGGSKCEFTGFLEKEAIYIKQFFIVLCSTLCCVLYTANSTEKKTIQENKRAGYCKGDNWFWRPEESFSKPDARCWVNLGSYIPFSFTLRPLYLPF